jgi:hypothetical protein
MTETAVPTLVDFLQARIAEEEDADRRAFLADVPEPNTEQASEAWDRLTMTALLRANIALRQLGWSLCYTFGAFGLNRRVAREAAKYSDHPDYRSEWAVSG